MNNTVINLIAALQEKRAKDLARVQKEEAALKELLEQQRLQQLREWDNEAEAIVRGIQVTLESELYGTGAITPSAIPIVNSGDYIELNGSLKLIPAACSDAGPVVFRVFTLCQCQGIPLTMMEVVVVKNVAGCNTSGWIKERKVVLAVKITDG